MNVPEDLSEVSEATTNESLKMSNPAWADAMSKILKTKKPKGKPLVLSKAKIISATDLNKIKQEKEDVDDTFEVVDKGGQKVAAPVNIEEIKDEKPDLEHLEPKIPNRIRVSIVFFKILFVFNFNYLCKRKHTQCMLNSVSNIIIQIS